MVIDIIDEKLLEVLQENARISISELSKRINLSLSAVSERLKKLEASGIITGYTTILNPEEMDKHISAIIMVAMDKLANDSEFVKLINSEEDILECSRITGEYDYFLRVYSKNQESVQTIIDKIKAVKNVTKTNTDVFLGNIKMRYSVPPVASK